MHFVVKAVGMILACLCEEICNLLRMRQRGSATERFARRRFGEIVCFTVSAFRLALLNSKTNVPSIQKLAQSSLVLMVHARDILSALGRAKNISPLCFEWNRQLRYYWQTDEEHCNIEQLQAKYDGSYCAN